MFRGVEDMYTALSMLLPPWAVATLGVIVVLIAAPMWLKNLKTKRIRGLARRMVRADQNSRQQLFDEVLDLAGDDADRLASTAQICIKYGVYDLRDEAIRRLEATGKLREELIKLQETLKDPPKKALHPLEVAVNIERLIAEEMYDTARQQLEEALIRFPGDEELLALCRRLADRAADATSGSGSSSLV